jgi:hypothetical protein
VLLLLLALLLLPLLLLLLLLIRSCHAWTLCTPRHLYVPSGLLLLTVHLLLVTRAHITMATCTPRHLDCLHTSSGCADAGHSLKGLQGATDHCCIL